MAYKGAGFGSNSTMPVPNRGPLNGPWVAPAPRKSAAGQAPGGFNKMVAGIGKIDTSSHKLSANSPAPGNNSPVGGAAASKSYAQSSPAKVPTPTPRPARAAAAPVKKAAPAARSNQTFYAGDAPRGKNPYAAALYKAQRSK